MQATSSLAITEEEEEEEEEEQEEEPTHTCRMGLDYIFRTGRRREAGTGDVWAKQGRRVDRAC